MMKKLTLPLLTLAFLLIFSSIALAGGSAIVPGIYRAYTNSSSYGHSALLLTNITGETITCKVYIYDHDGVDISNTATINSGSATSSNHQVIARNTSTFTIPPNSTRSVDLYRGALENRYGYALVTWQSNNPLLTNAMIGVHNVFGRANPGTSYQSRNLINNGLPF